MKQKIYISSTFKDLKEYRSLLKSLFENQLSNSFALCKIMEQMWDDGSQTPFVDECVREVKASKIYIIILGNKVGSFPPDENRTYTEIELDTAIAENKKMFFFKFKTFTESEIDNKEKHTELIAKFDGKPSHTFSNEVELKAALLECLIPHIPTKQEFKTKLLSLNSPSDPEFFLGREEERIKITERLEKRGELMLINSEGGIGKTTLAAKYWHESLNTYKHAAWCFCEDGIMKSLLELALQLNVDLSGYATEDDQIKALKRALHEVQHDLLLVLDNANNEDDILAFKQEFEGFHWHVLMTSRCQGVLNEDCELPIIHLPPPLAKALFLNYYPINIDDKETEKKIDQIIKALDYHTLVVEIFAKNIKEALGITSIDEFLTKLENEGLLLGEDSFEIKTDYAQQHMKNSKATSDDILNVLYDFSILENNLELRTVAINLAVLPAGEFNLEMLFTLVSDGTKTGKIKLKENLIFLNKNGWITKINESYRMSPVVQELILNKNKDILANINEALLDNILKRLENDCFEFKNEILDVSKYINYYKRFAKVIKPETDKSTHYTYCCLLYYRIIGNYNLYKECIDLFYKQSYILHDKNPENPDYVNNIGIAFEQYGNYYQIIGDRENTIKCFEKYVESSKSISLKFKNISDYTLNWTISLARLAKCFFENNDMKSAYKCQIKRLNLLKELINENHENLNYIQNLASTFSELGKLEEENGALDIALKYFNQQLILFNKLNDKKPDYVYYKVGVATAYQDIGSVLFSQTKYSEGLEYFYKYNKLFKELVNGNPFQIELKKGLATSFIKLAEVNFKINNLQKGFEYIIIAYELYFDLNESTQWQNVDYVYNYSGVCRMIFSIYSTSILKGNNENILYYLNNKGYTTIIINEISENGDMKYNELISKNLLPNFLFRN